MGFKRGTGGTAGVACLRKMLEVQLFPELWNIRTQLSNQGVPSPESGRLLRVAPRKASAGPALAVAASAAARRGGG